MNSYQGWELEFLDQKKKQRFFQKTPLYLNGTLKYFFCQAPIYYGAKTLSTSTSLSIEKGQGGKYGWS